jgi:hypothetical protein
MEPMGTTMLGSFLSFCSKWYLQVTLNQPFVN